MLVTSDGVMSRSEAARRVGVTAQTLARWGRDGLVPQARDGRWTPAAVAQARIVARLRERGHSLDEIRRAIESGRLAFGFVEEILPTQERAHTLEEAAAETGLEPALIERLFLSMGFQARALEQISDDDLELLRHVAAVLSAGFPLVALLQLVRVYGQALAQMADAEVRPSISTCTSHSCATASRDGRWGRRWRSSRAHCCRWPRRSWSACTSAS